MKPMIMKPKIADVTSEPDAWHLKLMNADVIERHLEEFLETLDRRAGLDT